jgi:hypothetical protein
LLVKIKWNKANSGSHQAGSVLEQEPHALVLCNAAIHWVLVLELVALLDLGHLRVGGLNQPEKRVAK